MPPPLQNNTAPATAACYIGEPVQQLVVAKDAAWEWTHEGPVEVGNLGRLQGPTAQQPVGVPATNQLLRSKN